MAAILIIIINELLDELLFLKSQYFKNRNQDILSDALTIEYKLIIDIIENGLLKKVTDNKVKCK